MISSPLKTSWIPSNIANGIIITDDHTNYNTVTNTDDHLNIVFNKIHLFEYIEGKWVEFIKMLRLSEFWTRVRMFVEVRHGEILRDYSLDDIRIRLLSSKLLKYSIRQETQYYNKTLEFGII